MKEETKEKRQTKKIRKRTYVAERDGKTITVTKSVETSPERAEAVEIVREMARAYIGTIEFYKAAHGGDYPHEEAVKQALSMNKFRRSQIEGVEPERVDWTDLAAIAEVSVNDSFDLWVRISEAATDEMESGRRAGKVTGRNVKPYELAQFYAIRNSFADQWNPQGGIEWAMIDMLVVAFSLQMYWSEVAHYRATEFHDRQKKAVRQYESQGWKSPFQSEADAIEQAHRLADSYNRQFLRVLRQLRDLRRYSPVVIQNNGGQVNVGNQQIVQQSNENSKSGNQK